MRITALGWVLAWGSPLRGADPCPDKELFRQSVPQLVQPAQMDGNPGPASAPAQVPDNPPSPAETEADAPTDAPTVAEMLRRSDWDFEQLPAFGQRLVRTAMESPTVPYRHPYEGSFLEKLDHVLFPEPAVVRVGQTYMSGGIVTAIKKKNPFGLINQTVFMLSF